MGYKRRGDAFAGVGGEGFGPSGLQVDADTRQKRARGHFLGFLVHHFVRKEDNFLANLLETRANRDHVAREQFAFVLDALLDRRQANSFLAQTCEECRPTLANSCQVASSNFPTYHITFMWPM